MKRPNIGKSLQNHDVRRADLGGMGVFTITCAAFRMVTRWNWPQPGKSLVSTQRTKTLLREPRLCWVKSGVFSIL